MPLGDQIRHIVNQMKQGALTYEEARERTAPLLAEMNDVMKKRCKENGVRFKKVSFEAFAR